MSKKTEFESRLDELAAEEEEEDLSLELQREKARGKKTRSQLFSALKTSEKELEGERAKVAFLLALSKSATKKRKPFKITASARKSLPAGCYVMMASDWHMGERVRPENVGWRNEYNPDIAQERAEQFFKSNLTMLDVNRKGWEIKDVMLWLGGDLMTGYIHEEYLEENFLSPVEESLLVFDTMVRGIDTLLAKSDAETIYVPTSNGNHGRTGIRMKIASYAKNSYEWMLYKLLETHYIDESRIKFQIAQGYNNIVDIYGYKIRFHHGDAVKYGGGVGGISIPLNRRIGRQATANRDEHIDMDGIAHFHSLQAPKLFVGNGSLIGWNDFAERIGCEFESPQQCSFVIDSAYKARNAVNPIFVTPHGGK